MVDNPEGSFASEFNTIDNPMQNGSDDGSLNNFQINQLNKPLQFINENLFEIINSEFYDGGNCFYNGENFQTSVKKYIPKDNKLRYMATVITDPKVNLGKNTLYDSSYRSILDLLDNGKMDTEEIEYMDFMLLVNSACAGDAPSLGFTNKLNYINTEKAAYAFFYGTSQSVVDDKGFFPIRFNIVGVRQNQIILITINGLQLMDIINNIEDLTKCVNRDTGFIDINKSPGRECVEDIVVNQIDMTKISLTIDDALELFEIR